MKKLIFSFLCGATMFPAFSQTYQELSECAVAAPRSKTACHSAEKYIEQALKMEPANPHNALLFSNLGTIQTLAAPV